MMSCALTHQLVSRSVAVYRLLLSGQVYRQGLTSKPRVWSTLLKRYFSYLSSEALYKQWKKCISQLVNEHDILNQATVSIKKNCLNMRIGPRKAFIGIYNIKLLNQPTQIQLTIFLYGWLFRFVSVQIFVTFIKFVYINRQLAFFLTVLVLSWY